MSHENKLIESLKKKFSFYNKKLIGIGDDCAFLHKENILITTDSFVEGVHFDLTNSSPNDVAYKFMCANYSDIQCSGGVAKYCLLNISYPIKKSFFMKVFLKKLIILLKYYNIKLIGGDTTGSNDKISLTMTLIGSPVKEFISRSSAKENEDMYVFSDIGLSKLGYDILYKQNIIKHFYTIIIQIKLLVRLKK